MMLYVCFFFGSSFIAIRCLIGFAFSFRTFVYLFLTHRTNLIIHRSDIILKMKWFLSKLFHLRVNDVVTGLNLLYKEKLIYM